MIRPSQIVLRFTGLSLFWTILVDHSWGSGCRMTEVSLLPIYHQAFRILFFRGSQLSSDDSTIILLPTSPPLIRCSVLTSLLFVFSGPQLSERVL